MSVRRTKEGAHLERVAMALLGSPSRAEPDERGSIRFGDFGVNLKTGKFYDFDQEDGGDAAELVRRIKKVENGAAEEWIRTNVLEAKPEPLHAGLEAERQLIGLLAVDPKLIAGIEEEIAAADFTGKHHGSIFEAVAKAHVEARPPTITMLVDACGGDPLLPVYGGRTLQQYIAQLMAAANYDEAAPDVARRLARAIRTGAELERGTLDERELDPGPQPFVSRFDGIPFEELDQPGAEHEYVIDGVLTVGDKSVIGGASQSGKSFLAIHMAMCIATGTPFFGHKVMKPGLVIYQAGEGQRGIKKRFRAWRRYFGAGKKGQRVPIFILQARVDIHHPEGDTRPLIEEIRGIERLYNLPAIALFIDTLQKAQGAADENSGKDMGTVMGNVDRIGAALPGCHIGLVHHMNAGGTKLRGHTSVYAGVDQVILVEKDEKKVRTMRLDKQKDDEDGTEIAFELMQIEVGRREIDGKPITSCVTLPVGEKMEVRGVGRRADRTVQLSDQNKLVYSALKEALAAHGEPTPAILKLPKSITTVVNVAHWKGAYAAVDGSTDDKNINQAMKRASDKLLNLRVIGRINPWVWLTDRAVADAPPLAAAQGNVDAGPPVQQDMEDDDASWLAR